MPRGELPPDPVVKRDIRWEWSDHPKHGRIVRLWSRTFGTWSLQRPWTGTLHEGLAAGLGSAALVDRLLEAGHASGDRERALRRVRMYLFLLRDEGYVELDFGAPPQRLGPYRIVRELGRGGVGVAWLGEGPDGQPVVVKHAWDYFQPLESMDALVRREASVLAALDHPGIARVRDSFEEGGLFHLVRDFVDGAGLLETLSGHPLPLGRVVSPLVDILEHLHARGFLALDLRPANFFVPRGGERPVLIDVGVCVPWTGGTLRLKRSLGSPGFSAPETRLRHRASPASDVFALGRLVFTVAAGRSPLADWGVAEMRPLLPDAPWCRTLLAMCAEDPDARPSLAHVRAIFEHVDWIAPAPQA